MRRHHPVPSGDQQQQQHQQPLDLLASAAMSESEQQPRESPSLPVRNVHAQRVTYGCVCNNCWFSLERHSQSVVFVIFAVSLLLNATIVFVVCWRLNTGCPALQPSRPRHQVVIIAKLIMIMLWYWPETEMILLSQAFARPSRAYRY